MDIIIIITVSVLITSLLYSSCQKELSFDEIDDLFARADFICLSHEDSKPPVPEWTIREASSQEEWIEWENETIGRFSAEKRAEILTLTRLRGEDLRSIYRTREIPVPTEKEIERVSLLLGKPIEELDEWIIDISLSRLYGL
jgi:hypothetical protein